MDLGSNQQPDTTQQATIILNKKTFYKKSIFIICLVAFVVLGVAGIKLVNFNGASIIPSTANNLKYQNQINQLNDLVNSIQQLDNPINPQISREEFANQKENIKIQAQQLENALKAGDIEKAKERAIALRASIINLGDPDKSRYLTKEEKSKIDPSNMVLGPFENIDPALIENGIYPLFIEVNINLRSLRK